MHDVVDDKVRLRHLREEFERAVHVAQRAGGVRAAAGDGVDLCAAGAAVFGHLLRLGVHVAARRAVFDAGAVQHVEEDVAVVAVVLVGVAGAVLQQARPGRSSRRLAGVVRLRRALGHHHLGAFLHRLRHQEFQLAGLVAAGREAGAVVTLDPEFRPAQQRRKPWHGFQRRGQVGEAEARETGEVHGVVFRQARRAVVGGTAVRRASAESAWPVMPSAREITLVARARAGSAVSVARCHVTVLRNLWTESPPV